MGEQVLLAEGRWLSLCICVDGGWRTREGFLHMVNMVSLPVLEKKSSSSSVVISCVTSESVTRAGVNNGIACRWR